MSRGTIARTIGEHWVSGPNGGTATESWCDCTCGARITVPGGTRDEAWRRGGEHQADAVCEALLTDDTIERAAIALYEAAETFGAKKTQWHEQTDEVRADWTRHATTALRAALGIEGEES